MRIGLKLTAAFLGIASVVGGAGYLARATSREVNQQMQRLSRSAVIKAEATEMVDLLYAGQSAAHAVIHAHRRVTVTNTPPGLENEQDDVLLCVQEVEQCLKRQRLAIEPLIWRPVEESTTALSENKATPALPFPTHFQQQFNVHQELMKEFLALAEQDVDSAAALLENRLCTHLQNELLPPLLTYRDRTDDEFTRGIRTTERAMVVADQRRGWLTGVAAAGAVLLGLFMSRHIGKPLGTLKQAALEIGQGRLDTRIPVHSQDEIGVLAATFNQMAADLQETTVSKERLLATLQEKELLLKEVHHRVKNNLQVISSLLNLQAQELRDPDMIRLLLESQGRVRSMALIHEQLYRSDDLSRIDFAAYVEQLVAHLKHGFGHAAGKVQVHLDVQPLPLALDLAIPSGMIVNELVSNAFKHAFPNGSSGEIRVQFVHDETGYQLTVADDGVGMRKESADGEEVSLGMKVIEALTRQLHGEFDVRHDGGTTCVLSFGGTSHRRSAGTQS